MIFGNRIKSKLPYIGALVASTVIAILNVLKILGLLSTDTIGLFNKIPFFSMDLGWITPSIAGFIIGLLISKFQQKEEDIV